MSYGEEDAAMEDFFDHISEELFPMHKEIAIELFIEERMQSYFMQNPSIINAPMECTNHANELIQISPSCALVMYTTAIELFLKSVLLKPVLYGMIHNEKIASLIVESSTSQSGFTHYTKLIRALCLHAANIDIDLINGMEGKPILKEAENIQKIRNKVIHQGYKAADSEMGRAKNIAYLMLQEVVEPVLIRLNLVVAHDNSGYYINEA